MKPMLASKYTGKYPLKFPVIVSPKLDGIRCLIHKGQAVSRQLKPIPNEFIQVQLQGLPEGLDGELMLNIDSGFNAIQGAVMKEEGTPDFIFYVFDKVGEEPYEKRIKEITLNNGFASVLDYAVVNNEAELFAYEDIIVKLGYEGIMIRSPDAPYKFGRSTEKEGYLLKLKRFEDSEVTVIGFEERMHNANEAEKDNLGRTKRSSHKENLVPTDTLGSLVVKQEDGIQFNIGTGFTDAQRKEIWDNREFYKGKLVTVMYQELTEYGVPRFPVFKGFRKDL